MLSTLRRLLRDSRGATLVEYALIIALMVIAMIVALRGVADSSINMWNSVSSTVSNST
jgi:pilus assembly protein Flp/PilA